MPAKIVYQDTPAHFAPLFTAHTPKAIAHVDAYLVDIDFMSGKPIQLGLRSWISTTNLLVADISALPGSRTDDAPCFRTVLVARWGARAFLQRELFAEPTLSGFFEKFCTRASTIAPNKAGWQVVPINKDAWVQVQSRPARCVFSPFLKYLDLGTPPQKWDATTAAAWIASGNFIDLRKHLTRGAATRPDPFAVARALVEVSPTIITWERERCVFSNAAFPGALMSFEPISDPQPELVAPPAPAGERAVTFG